MHIFFAMSKYIYVCVCVCVCVCESEVTQSCLTLCDPMDCSLPGSSPGFSRQEYWSGLPFPSPGDLPNSGIELWSPTFLADVSTSDPPGIHINA